jgi:hypothetical protein
MWRVRTLLPAACLATVVATGMLASAAAWAQDNVPPQPSLTRTPKPWVGYAIMFLLLVLVLGVSLMPSKRGHQD